MQQTATIHQLFKNPKPHSHKRCTSHSVTSNTAAIVQSSNVPMQKAAKVSCGALWEQSKHLPMNAIRDLIRQDINDCIDENCLPHGEYRIIVNSTAISNTVRIAVHDLAIERLFDEKIAALSIDTMFSTPERYLSVEARRYRSMLENIVNLYNRRIISAEGRVISSHYESGVIYNSSFLLKRICQETLTPSK